MISDAELQHYAEKDRDVWPDFALAEMAKELLQRRQADWTACHWKQDRDGNWETGCGNLFSFIEGGPKENDTKYCQYCGNHVEAHYYD